MFMPFEWYSTFEVLNIFNVNTFGPVNMTRTFIPHLRRSRGRIVNVASAGGRNSYPNSLIYCMSKHALVALSDGLRRELAPFGISVASIEPQAYRTPLFNAERLKQNMKASFRSCSEDVKQAYGEGYDERLAEAMITNVYNDRNGAIVRNDINEVVDCMVHALTAVKPRHRYCPPEPLYIIAEFLLSLLPSEIVDGIFNTLLAPLSFNALSSK
ncbi:unnamed protein product [Owenia fusiformis]|nr:unnamed protein product [Owenia fusiformis]